jgi:hypothetical protein
MVLFNNYVPFDLSHLIYEFIFWKSRKIPHFMVSQQFLSVFKWLNNIKLWKMITYIGYDIATMNFLIECIYQDIVNKGSWIIIYSSWFINWW